MGLITRAELRQQIRTVTDANAETLALEQQHHISDTFLNQRINAHGPRLFRKIQRAREDFLVREVTLQSKVGEERYELPLDFIGLLRARAYDGTNYYDMGRWAFGPEDAALKQWESSGGTSSHAGLYRHHVVTIEHGKKSLWVQPTPQVATHQFQCIYTPSFRPLTDDNMTLDGFDGWEQYIVYAVAKDVHQRRNSDPSLAMQCFAEIDAELDQAIIAIDLSRPEVVRDTMGDDSHYPNAWPSYYSDV